MLGGSSSELSPNFEDDLQLILQQVASGQLSLQAAVGVLEEPEPDPGASIEKTIAAPTQVSLLWPVEPPVTPVVLTPPVTRAVKEVKGPEGPAPVLTEAYEDVDPDCKGCGVRKMQLKAMAKQLVSLSEAVMKLAGEVTSSQELALMVLSCLSPCSHLELSIGTCCASLQSLLSSKGQQTSIRPKAETKQAEVLDAGPLPPSTSLPEPLRAPPTRATTPTASFPAPVVAKPRAPFEEEGLVRFHETQVDRSANLEALKAPSHAPAPQLLRMPELGPNRLDSYPSPRLPRATPATPYEQMMTAGITRREPANEVPALGSNISTPRQMPRPTQRADLLDEPPQLPAELLAFAAPGVVPGAVGFSPRTPAERLRPHQRKEWEDLSPEKPQGPQRNLVAPAKVPENDITDDPQVAKNTSQNSKGSSQTQSQDEQQTQKMLAGPQRPAQPVAGEQQPQQSPARSKIPAQPAAAGQQAQQSPARSQSAAQPAAAGQQAQQSPARSQSAAQPAAGGQKAQQFKSPAQPATGGQQAQKSPQPAAGGQQAQQSPARSKSPAQPTAGQQTQQAPARSKSPAQPAAGGQKTQQSPAAGQQTQQAPNRSKSPTQPPAGQQTQQAPARSKSPAQPAAGGQQAQQSPARSKSPAQPGAGGQQAQQSPRSKSPAQPAADGQQGQQAPARSKSPAQPADGQQGQQSAGSNSAAQPASTAGEPEKQSAFVRSRSPPPPVTEKPSTSARPERSRSPAVAGAAAGSEAPEAPASPASPASPPPESSSGSASSSSASTSSKGAAKAEVLQRSTTGSLPGPSRPRGSKGSNAALPARAGSLRLPARAGSLHFGSQKPR